MFNLYRRWTGFQYSYIQVRAKTARIYVNAPFRFPSDSSFSSEESSESSWAAARSVLPPACVDTARKRWVLPGVYLVLLRGSLLRSCWKPYPGPSLLYYDVKRNASRGKWGKIGRRRHFELFSICELFRQLFRKQKLTSVITNVLDCQKGEIYKFTDYIICHL